MEWSTFLWTTLGAFLTLCTFSFLYKDNPFYKFAEHLVVGVSAGYFALVLWHQILIPNLFERLNDGDWYLLWINSSRFWYLIPAALGVMMWTRFSRKRSWISRWPIALYMGIAAGMAVPREMQARVIEQLWSAMRGIINWGNFFSLDATAGIASVIIFLGTLAALFYFFFSKEHTGPFKIVSNFGIWILMIGFGASFGYTVMGRISLFVQRIQVLNDWTIIAWEPGKGGFKLFWFLVFGVFIIWAVFEIVSFFNRRGKVPEA
ncbi:MAG: hypothetical protein AB1746_04245 [Candidatus Zixiibacteriota bacterium]